jgi:hypothetical protein
VFHQLRLIGVLEQRQTISTLKNRNSRRYSFQKLTLFSQGNNVLDAVASNIHGYLWKDPCVSSCQLNSPIYSQERLPPLKMTKLQEVFLSQSTSFLTGK